MKIFDVFCPECESSFTVELTEEGKGSSTPDICPFCGEDLTDEDFTVEEDDTYICVDEE